MYAMQTMLAPCAKAEILWDLRLLATRRRMVKHLVLLTGAKWLRCVSMLICKGQIITELAILEPETVSLRGGRGGGERGWERRRAGIKIPPFREKKGERTCKVHYNSLLKGFFCLQNGSFEEGNPGYLRVWLKIRQKKSWLFKC